MALLSRPLPTPPPSADAGETQPTSLRLPPELRVPYTALAERLGGSLHQSLLLTLKAVAGADPLTLRALLMETRVRQLLTAYQVHPLDMQQIHPALTPETATDGQALLARLDRSVMEALANECGVPGEWVSGESNAVYLDNWNRNSPVHWAQAQSNPRRVDAFVFRVAGATWEATRPSEDDSTPQSRVTVVLNAPGRHIALRATAWKFERISYSRGRSTFRKIITGLHSLDIPLQGQTVTVEQFEAFERGELLPPELIAAGRRDWNPVPVLVVGQGGLYADEDRYVDS